ncbi:hypothetical protein G4G28_11425 [Massilia sp. Dwa41.01b]|uniref:T6SS immunity protein Tli4 family protein n=1 Tax=Massilia sp. Dwa41.01b TaxID=2709302 RepID=UPI00160192E0|nr:T6SS immunity protein Tli4 family protein [Massilia sp. Dwa41.01b]QNA88945.1 hypothetical protein G4G28_11425 [Massilia sp. Dwa41.01b]
MMRIVRRCTKWLLALAVVAIGGLAGIRAVHSGEDMKKVATMTERMKTVCVGRFLVDVPEDAQVSLKPARVGGFDITRNEESVDQFTNWLSTREAKLVSAANMLGRKNVESSKEIRGEGFVGKILVHSRYRSYSVEKAERKYYETVSIEGHVNKGGATFSFNSEGDDPSRVPVVAALMTQLLSRANDEIPATPGFCINRAVLADPSQKELIESVPMFASFPGHPDLVMAFWSNSGASPGPGLLERSAAALDDTPFMRARSRILREKGRIINGLAGEEFAVKGTELNFATGYSFNWEMAGKEGDPYLPSLSLELRAGVNPRAGGKPVQSSLSEDAMLKLWDKISSSIRLRPTSVEKVAKAEAPAMPLGAYAEAGERCPQSGWWLCTDAGRDVGVLGGQRQYLRAGQKMPQALLLPPQTLWQKVRGLQPSYESRTRTAWKLVDKRERARVDPVVPLAQATLAAQVDAGNAIGSPFSLAQPGAPIGCCAKTGMQCPASGWWRCEESSALDGTRWFAAGSLLPAATFTLPSSGFGRGFGKPESIQRRSLWQLVRHATQPGYDTGDPEPDSEFPDSGLPDAGDAPGNA